MGGPAAGGQQQGGAAPGGKGGGQIPPELLAAQMAQQGQRGGAMPVQGRPVSYTQGMQAQANAMRQMQGGAGGMPSLASKAAAVQRGAAGDKGGRGEAMGNLPTNSLAGAKGGAKRK